MLRHLIVSLYVLSLGIGPSAAATHHADLLHDLSTLDTACNTLCSPTNTHLNLPGEIERLADGLNLGRLDRRTPQALVAALNEIVFEKAGIHPSSDLKNPNNLFLSQVLERREGYCVGIVSLYLVLAERLGIPLYAVATPSHVFLRYDDGITRINIETLQRGANVPDAQYIREQRIPEISIRRGIFMKNLDRDGFLAQVHNNLGVIYSERGRYDEAASEYKRALELLPQFPAAYYNCGNDLLLRGQAKKAVRQFSKSLRLYPTDVWALNNRGLAYLKRGKRDRARRDFEEALRIDPAFQVARKNLERIAEPPQSP